MRHNHAKASDAILGPKFMLFCLLPEVLSKNMMALLSILTETEKP